MQKAPASGAPFWVAFTVTVTWACSEIGLAGETLAARANGPPLAAAGAGAAAGRAGAGAGGAAAADSPAVGSAPRLVWRPDRPVAAPAGPPRSAAWARRPEAQRPPEAARPGLVLADSRPHPGAAATLATDPAPASVGSVAAALA